MTDVVGKLWGLCQTLRHDGIDYGDYIEQLTYLLFLKMADERGVELPYKCDWDTLESKAGIELTDHYADVLTLMRSESGLLGDIYAPSNRGYGLERSKFTHDGEDVVVEDTNGTVVKYQNGLGIDNKLSVKQGSVTNYFLADQLGSTDALTDSTGAVTALQTCDSFGNGSNSTFPTRYQFTGREYDPTLGLQYYRARMYDPKLGRFTSEDPIGFGGGNVNLYGYVGNGPTGKRDPLGLYEIDVHYYLTLYLSMRTGCFSQGQSVAIANGNQMTDENESESPDFNRRYQNSTYHALNPNAYPGQLSPHLQTMASAPQINFAHFGRSLHYLQDSYSHAGFSSNIYGHAFAGHKYDKTNSNPGAAFRMVASTWNAMQAFGRKLGCECKRDLTSGELDTIGEFIGAPGSKNPALNAIDSVGGLHDFLITNPSSYLDRKRSILGLPLR